MALVLTISSAVKVNVKGVVSGVTPDIEAVPTVNVSPTTYPDPPEVRVTEEIEVSSAAITHVIVAPVPDKLPVVPTAVKVWAEALTLVKEVSKAFVFVFNTPVSSALPTVVLVALEKEPLTTLVTNNESPPCWK